jgi:hypothetical protein
VNNGEVGFDNLRDVFGPDITTLFRDWSISTMTDNLTGVAPRYQQLSWNMRSIYTALYGSYPLETFSLAAGTPRNVQIRGGGAAYLRFAVPEGAVGDLSWGTPPASMLMTVVRVR